MQPGIIFEDSDICVVDKPSGMVVNRADTVKTETVQDWFAPKLDKNSQNKEFFDKGGVVHRLDKETSGVMILAKNENAYEKLKEQFLTRKTEKVYVALVHGRMPVESGIVSVPVERNPREGKKFTTGNNLSRMAVTEWKVLKNFGSEFSLLELKPMTGRTHQIRVHMKYLGHPIVSDPWYGFAKTWKSDLEICPRLFLHATKLTISGRTFESPYPQELLTAMEKIGKLV